MPLDSTSTDQIIGEVAVTPSEPNPADSVLVEVRAPDGSVISGADGERIRINGITGARQYLQFARSGKQSVFVVAERNGAVERRVVEVNVKSLAATTLGTAPATMNRDQKKLMRKAVAELPLLQVGKFADTPYRMAFSVGGFRSFSDGLANGRPFAK